MIQIKETEPGRAAHEIADVMDAQGGEWIVNGVDDEGYIMARVDSHYGRMLQRSGSPSLSGPFNARWKIVFIAADIQEAKTHHSVRIARKVETASRRLYRGKKIRRSRNTVMLNVTLALTPKPLTSDVIAEKIGVDEQCVRNALRRLMRGGTVRRGRKVPSGGRSRALYEAVA